MQNKGAIRLFAILLALACAYYLMFTWVASGIEKDAEAYAESYVETKVVNDAAEKLYSSKADLKTYKDSVKSVKRNQYLDSLKKRPVYDLFVTQYTYEEVTNRQLNRGLD